MSHLNHLILTPVSPNLRLSHLQIHSRAISCIIHHNQLESVEISPRSKPFQSLELFVLDSNRLESLIIPANLFPRLKCLSVSKNFLSGMETSSGARVFPALETLCLSHNRLRSIPEFVFECENLIELDLRGNNIAVEHLNLVRLREMRHLERLHLGENPCVDSRKKLDLLFGGLREMRRLRELNGMLFQERNVGTSDSLVKSEQPAKESLCDVASNTSSTPSADSNQQLSQEHTSQGFSLSHKYKEMRTSSGTASKPASNASSFYPYDPQLLNKLIRFDMNRQRSKTNKELSVAERRARKAQLLSKIHAFQEKGLQNTAVEEKENHETQTLEVAQWAKNPPSDNHSNSHPSEEDAASLQIQQKSTDSQRSSSHTKRLAQLTQSRKDDQQQEFNQSSQSPRRLSPRVAVAKDISSLLLKSWIPDAPQPSLDASSLHEIMNTPAPRRSRPPQPQAQPAPVALPTEVTSKSATLVTQEELSARKKSRLQELKNKARMRMLQSLVQQNE
mmetsp:Transcript_7849/g.29384  ORF Transcript_7849/g.29384 Transcript_7849/m.29384 type:complete len:505 (+) Transcript_7849:31-1545(+)